MYNQTENTAAGGGGGWMVQNPSNGQWFPIEQEGQYPNGNIQGPDGTVYSHFMGMDLYQQQQTAAPQDPTQDPSLTKGPTPPPPPGDYTDPGINPPGDIPPPPSAPPPGGYPPSGGGYGGGGALINEFPEAAPNFAPPTYTPPPAFRAPSWEDAYNDPGYQFVQKMGQQGVERSAAARGVLNSGGTLQDIAQWNQGLAGTQYQNVFDRNLQTYNTNYGTQYADPYRNAYQRSQDTYNSAYQKFRDDYQRWLDRIHESANLTTL